MEHAHDPAEDSRNLISEAAAAAILGVSHRRANQSRAEGKLATAGTAGLGGTRILYRRSDVERLRVERGVGLLAPMPAVMPPHC